MPEKTVFVCPACGTETEQNLVYDFMKVVLECDQCGKRVEEKDAINWVSTIQIGLELREWSAKPIEGVFCSKKCCVEYLSSP